MDGAASEPQPHPAESTREKYPELMPRLFQPFVSDKETGLGMGLVISRRIIESHGGTLTAANAPTGGAIFTITFPAETNLNGES